MAIGFPAKTNFATGDVLTATNMNDITGTLNLLQQDLYPAGRNKIINGDFNINQRTFTSTTSTSTFGFDRWLQTCTDGTVTYSAQTFTAGTAPVVGYESTNFARQVSTGQTLTTANSILSQKIKNVRTFANQTATVSFWAKAGSGTPKVAVEFQQGFGTSGSASVNTYGGQVTLSTSWARYSVTFTGSTIVPSVAGKTITSDSSLRLNLWTSAGSSFNSRTGSLGIQSSTIDFWGVQVENGSTASPFQTATGTVQGELAACQRYYYRNTGGEIYSRLGTGAAEAANGAQILINLPVTMRTNPTSVDFSTLALYDLATIFTVTAVVLSSGAQSPDIAGLFCNVASGLTVFRFHELINNNSTSAYIGFSAEL